MSTSLHATLQALIAAGGNDLSDALSDLSAAEWRALVAAAADHRCTVCGEIDACKCPGTD